MYMIDMKNMALNLVGTALIGGFVGLVVDHSMIAAITSGYAGIDIAENVLKINKVI